MIYLITIENSPGEQRLIEEIFLKRQNAGSRVETSDARFCYYYIYEVTMENNTFAIKMVDKIWNNP